MQIMKGSAIEEVERFNYYMNDEDERRQEEVVDHDYMNNSSNNDDENESMESIERMYNKFRRRYLINGCQRKQQSNRRNNISGLIWIPGYGLIRS